MKTPSEQGTAWNLLPLPLRKQVFQLDPPLRDSLEELRLRVGNPLTLVSRGSEWMPPAWENRHVTQEDISWVLEVAGHGSVHTILDQFQQGFVAVDGGHRIGICGSVSLRNGDILNFRHISSLAIRLAHEVKEVGKPVLSQLFAGDTLQNTLLFSPPGAGKTTLLRDLVRRISNGVGCRSLRVGVADERGELCGMQQGRPTREVGRCTDILDGCPKAQALLMLLRGMNPQVLAMDEVTDPRDLSAMEEVAGCGVTLMATAHGASPEELTLRPIYRDILQRGLFRRFVWITMEGGKRCYRVLTEKEMQQDAAYIG